MSGLGGLNKSPAGVVLGMVQLQLPVVSTKAHLKAQTKVICDMVKKARAKGITPMSLGVGDRPFPGAFLTHEALLEKLGLDADALPLAKVLEGGTWAAGRRIAAVDRHERRGAHYSRKQRRPADESDHVQPAGE